MSAGANIRAARPSDAAAIAGLIRRSFEPERLATTIYGCAGIDAFVRDQIEAPAERADRRFTVAGESAILGCADWCVDAQGVFLAYVAVDAEHRRTGLGNRLLRSLLDAAHVAEGATFRLDVYADNAAARAWYEGLGMRIESESELWDLPLPGCAPAAGVVISGWPQAVACRARFGFANLALVEPGRSWSIGLLGDRWLRIADPPLLSRPDLLAAAAEIDPRRRILAVVPSGTPFDRPSAGRLVATTLRLGAPATRVLERLRYP